ncbi:MAG: hypothetical protein CSB46_07420 [Micrococcales bacterium]|nr:MAG: hypothetical protein CSB46_07420 [Micrococcales bacterium]
MATLSSAVSLISSNVTSPATGGSSVPKIWSRSQLSGLTNTNSASRAKAPASKPMRARLASRDWRVPAGCGCVPVAGCSVPSRD